MKLLVDSGSTKADWIAIDDNGKVIFTTQSLGLNPEVLEEEEIINRLDNKFSTPYNIGATDDFMRAFRVNENFDFRDA